MSFPRDDWKEHSGPAQRISGATVDDELSEVESGAFFSPEPDREDHYMLRPEGLAYALALLLVEELRTTQGQTLLGSVPNPTLLSGNLSSISATMPPCAMPAQL